jgi:hypothetical protein
MNTRNLAGQSGRDQPDSDVREPACPLHSSSEVTMAKKSRKKKARKKSAANHGKRPNS